MLEWVPEKPACDWDSARILEAPECCERLNEHLIGDLRKDSQSIRVFGPRDRLADSLSGCTKPSATLLDLCVALTIHFCPHIRSVLRSGPPSRMNHGVLSN